MDRHADSESEIIENDGIITYRPNDGITSSEAFKKNLVSILKKMPSKVIFDLSNMQNIDSLELSLFVVFEKDIKKKNADIEVIIENLDIEIMKLFILTGLDQQFTISF